MRLFVAVYPPPPATADLAAVVARLAIGAPREPGRSVRAVPPDRWHLTLVFIGELPDAKEPAAREAIAAATVGGKLPRLSLGGGGRFGRGRFTTMWAGVHGDLAGLVDLGEAVRRQLRRARIRFDTKPMQPHLTLARPADRLAPAELAADLAALDEYHGPAWDVSGVELVRSHLGPNIRYDRIGCWPVG